MKIYLPFSCIERLRDSDLMQELSQHNLSARVRPHWRCFPALMLRGWSWGTRAAELRFPPSFPRLRGQSTGLTAANQNGPSRFLGSSWTCPSQ